jgi:hypothetical protein
MLLATRGALINHHHEHQSSATLDFGSDPNWGQVFRTIVGSVSISNDSKALSFRCAENGCPCQTTWEKVTDLVAHFTNIHGTQKNNFFCPHVGSPYSQAGGKRGFVDFLGCVEHLRRYHEE